MGTYPIVSSGDGASLANYTVVYVRRDPDGRPGHPDGDGSERQPRLRCRQPGLHRDARRARRTATPSPSPHSSAATTSSPVGTYPIVPLATGANLANYTVVYVDGTLTVGKATLTVTAANAGRAYGAANPVFIATATGAQGSDSLHPDGELGATTCRLRWAPTRSFTWQPDQPRELHRGLRQRDPDGRPGHPDGDGSERQPRLRCRQPGLHRDRDGRTEW